MSLWQYARAQWDRVGAGALFALGGLALVLGWIGVSREALTALQIPYIISGGLGGIFLLGLGAVFWLSADLRDEWRKLDAIERTLDADAAGARPVDRQEPGEPVGTSVAPQPEVVRASPAETITNGSRPSRRRPVRAST